MATIRIHSIEAESYVDGPGRRAVVWFQGCPIHCPGCQNSRLWPAQAGQEWEIGALAKHLAGLAHAAGGNLTITGGEPFTQPIMLAVLVNLLKQCYNVPHILVYSGYTIEQLSQDSHPARPFLAQIFRNIDVLVDGPFIAALDDKLISHRGSRNQRPIDVRATFERATGELVVQDWDPVEIMLSADGSVFMPVGMARPLGARLGTPAAQRRCGER